MNTSNQELARTIVDQFVATIAALTGVEAEASTVPALTTASCVAVIGPDDATDTWEIAFDREGAAALAQLILGSDSEPAADAVNDALSELCAQVAGAIASLSPRSAGWRLHAFRAPAEPARKSEMAVAIRVGSLAVPVTLGLAAPAQLTASGAAATNESSTERKGSLDRILDIELPVIVRFGRSELPLRTLTRLGPGALIDLGRSPEDPVDLLVGNRVIARGEVVVVGGNYGIRILDVINPHERVHSLEY
jgi:flagellar motor switch protein FliN/FliY